MTIEDIRNAIRIVDGQVVLAETTLNTAAITALLAEYGAQNTLTIRNAAITSTAADAFVMVAGDVTLVGVSVAATARFAMDGGDVLLDLSGTPPAGWTLGDSFTALKDSHLAALAPADPRLRLLSKATADGGTAGLALAAGFTLPPVLEVLRWFAAPAADATLAGPIALDGGDPVMTLTVGPPITASLGGLVSIDLTMQHVSKVYRTDDDPPKTAVAALSLLVGDLAFDHGGTPVTVPFQAGFTEATGVLTLSTSPGAAFDVALSEIAHWLGGTDLGTSGLPDSYRPPGGLTLHEVTFAIGLRTQRLEYVSLTVQSTKPWEVVDKITVSGIVLSFMVMPPRTPVLSATIEGTLALGTVVSLDVYAQLPDFLIRGHLTDGDPIDLIPLIQYLGGVSAELPSTLQIDVLSFEAHPAGSHYSFDIDVIGDWQVVPQFAVNELKASLRYDQSALDVLFDGRFTVAKVDVEVSAEYDSDAGGWQFTGAAADKAPIKLGDFIRDLAADFSSSAAQALPDFITSLEIEHLGVSFDTATKDFVFHCETLFTVESTALDLTVEITLHNADGGYTHTFGGSLVIGPVRFELIFEELKTGGEASSTSSMFLAAAQPEGGIDVKALVAHIDAAAGDLMPALTLTLEDALFLYRKPADGTATYLFGLAVGIDLDLGTLPLVGPVFRDSKLGGIKDIQALYASAAVDADDVGTFNGLLTQAKAKPALPTRAGATGTTVVLRKGFNFAASLELGGNPLPVTAGGDTAPPAAAPPAATATPPAPPAGNASWFDVKKSIGPVTLERIGVRYEHGRAWLLVDADFQLSALSLGLQGLALGFKLDDLTSVAVNLDGLSLDFESGPLSIAGGFLHLGDDYLGEARVKAASFGLTAVGGYAPDQKSFFIFVRLNAPLGGPPFFFVTGVAGGFGVNRNLIIPPIDDLTSFALLPANNSFPTKLDPQNPGGTLAATLASTERYVPPQPGVNWAAAGLDFTSFEMVDSSALVTVTFGIDFAVALLGISRVTVPKGAPEAIVYLEIALEARIKPDEGLLAVDGRLTPASYLYAKLCRITGGFAFYLWFSGANAGDFVISIGGYHPRFKKPDHYPTVPRLQLTYTIGDLVIKGQSYLALTPHMVMAGLRIDATWESGSLKAWFSAGIDFLLGWKPFHYEADAYIHIGVSLTLDLLFTSVSITIHVGVDLDIWGPPFGGRASIDLDIVSFTIHFGDSQRREELDWDGFKQSFLPAGTDKAAAQPAPHATRLAALADEAPPAAGTDGLLCTAGVADGLVRDLKAKDDTAFFSWIVDANHFAIQSNTLIPNKTAAYNGFDLHTPFTTAAGFTAATGGAPTPTPAYDTALYPDGVTWADHFGVLPMGLGADGFTTRHTVTVKRAAEGADYTQAASYTEAVDEIAVMPVVKAASSALWAPADPGLNGDRLIPGTLVGLRVQPMPQHPDITLKADLWAMLFDQNQQVSGQAVVPAADRSDPYAASADGPTLRFTLGGRAVTCEGYRLTALTDSSAAAARTATVGALNGLGFAFDTGAIDVADLAQYPLWDWPMIRTLGEEVVAS